MMMIHCTGAVTWQVEALLSEGGLQVPFKIEACDITLPELQEHPIVVSRPICTSRIQTATTRG
jgi:hypothetical protein